MVLLKATLYLKPCKHTADRVLKSSTSTRGSPPPHVGGAAAHIRDFVSSLTLLDPVTLMAALWGAAAM